MSMESGRLRCECDLEAYSQVYLPFYSEMAQERRKRVRDGTLGDARAGGKAGSMWENIDAAAKRGGVGSQPSVGRSPGDGKQL